MARVGHRGNGRIAAIASERILREIVGADGEEIGLGATELSATPAAIPALKAAVRGLDLAGCQALAARALAAADAAEVRALAQGGIG